MSKIVQEYIELMHKWSKLILEGKEEEGFALMKKGDALEAKFSRENWKELIDYVPNQQAKIAWTEKMNKLFPAK